MTALEALAVLMAGVAAGTINGVIGSGTLISFPVLLAVGYSPVVANVTNTLGLVPGSAAAVYGYREQLHGHRDRVLRLAPVTAVGAISGAALVLVLPRSAFEIVVPVLIALALVLVVAQPRLSAAIVARHRDDRPDGGPLLRGGIFATGVYGGYFGAGQGIMLFALLGIGLPDDIQTLNGLRNLLAGTANGMAAVVFLFAADVQLDAAALLALGATAGGLLGARIGRHLSPVALRGLIVAVGVVAIARLVL